MNLRLNWNVVIFADGDVGTVAAGFRLARQAQKMRQFSSVEVYDYSRLALECDVLGHLPENVFLERGFGYWLWKPFLINRTARKYPGEGILYLDAGCEFRSTSPARKRLRFLLNAATEFGFLAGLTSFAEIQYTKRDVCEHFGLSSEMLQSPQVAATWIAFVATDESCLLLDTWCGYALRRPMIDDSASLQAEHESFVEHRHDQSLLSCLAKNANLVVCDSRFSGSRWLRGIDAIRDPIVQHRNRTGASRIEGWRRPVAAVGGLVLDAVDTCTQWVSGHDSDWCNPFVFFRVARGTRVSFPGAT
jgi:hypothetical protein